MATFVEPLETARWKADLLPFWDAGMQKVSARPDLIKQAAEKTGLTEQMVKKWIQNYGKVLKREDEKARGVTHPRKPSIGRRPSGYTLFIGEKLKDPELRYVPDQAARLKAAAALWSALSREERQEWVAKAEEIIPEVPTAESQKLAIFKKIEKQCQELEELGYPACLFICPNIAEGQLHILGTSQATNIMSSVETAPFHRLYLRKCEGQERQKTVPIKEKRRKEVQAIFNNAFRAIRPTSRHCDYTLLTDGRLTASGLPGGIILKPPTTYSSTELQLLLEHQHDIIFQVQSSTVSSPAATVSAEDHGVILANEVATSDSVQSSTISAEDHGVILANEVATSDPVELTNDRNRQVTKDVVIVLQPLTDQQLGKHKQVTGSKGFDAEDDIPLAKFQKYSTSV